MSKLSEIKKELRKAADAQRAKAGGWFFKTEEGQYGAGDKFLGVTVPEQRQIAKKFEDLNLKNLQELLDSLWHEERLTALFILIRQYQKADDKNRQKIYNFYLANKAQVNNWDLVDASADKIIGAYLFDKPKNILYKLAKSKSLWDRRVAIIATFYFIKNNRFNETLKIVKILLNDEHDLIHKAVGWMLREVGNRSLPTEEKFLLKNYKIMPRTMLRYAIEKFPEKKRQAYLKGKI